jgi:hypothetical protein
VTLEERKKDANISMNSLRWREMIVEFQNKSMHIVSFRHEAGIRRELILNDVIH